MNGRNRPLGTHGPMRWAVVGSVLLTIAALACPAVVSADQDDATRHPIVLQLKWYHQFQFAGYYAAVAQGYYAAEGLDVTVREGGPAQPPVPAVLSGRATFGVTDSDVVLGRLKGQALVVCAAIFQHSPYGFMSRADRGIRTPADLVGMRVMTSDATGSAQLRAMLIREGIDPALVTFLEHSWSLDDLIAGRVDAISAYATVQPTQLRARGVEAALLRTIDYGVDFYGDTLFAAQPWVETHPQQTAAFVRASLRGWTYAMKHPEEIADRILAMPGVHQRGITRAFLLAEHAEMRAFVLPDVVPIGHMNRGRWALIAETFRDAGMAPRDVAIDEALAGFIYAPAPAGDGALVRWAVRIGGLGGGLAALVGLWTLQVRRRVRDRTEELRAEVAHRTLIERDLRANQRLLATAQRSAGLGIWQVDLATGAVVVSEETSRIFGVDHQTFPWSHEAFLSLVHPGDRERVREFAATRRTHLGHIEYRIVGPDGQERVIDERSESIGDASGSDRRVGMVFDITDRTLAEKELRAGEDRYRRQRNALIALTTSEPQGRGDLQAAMRRIAETYARTLGVARAGIWRFTPDHGAIECVELFDLVCESHASGALLDVASAPAYFAALEERDVLAVEDAQRDPRTRELADGYLVPAGVTSMLDAVITINGRDIGMLCSEHVGPLRAWRPDELAFVAAMANLIAVAFIEADRQRAERRIAEQAALLDKAQDAIMVRDLDHRITYWNKSAERLYGWTADEAIGRAVNELLDQDRDTFRQASAEVLAHGEWTGEIARTTRDGATVVVEGRWTLVRTADGAPASILAIDTDITARKHLEQQFLRAQRLESIGTLAGGIAHDLNNVLAPMMMATELLKDSVTDASGQAMLETMAVSVRRGADMVRQVLSFARGLEGRRVEVQLRHLVRDIETLVRDSFPKNIAVFTELPDDLWPILGDPTQLHQVVVNLCVNARDAMPDGGHIRIAARNTVLDPALVHADLGRTAGPHLCVTIEDTGVGIPKTILDKIFDPFFTTKAVGKGTGLGLSTSLAIVKSHAGFFEVGSELGHGTRFDIYLPAVQDGQGAGEHTERAPAHRGANETVLVVDDEASIRELVTRVLVSHGYRVLAAADGAEAVHLFQRHHADIDVVLTDMMMPVMDGASLIAALRLIDPSVRVIAASGMAARTDVLSLGVRLMLTKPYTMQQVLEALRAALSSEPALASAR